jgi:hypothetical protein
MATAKNSTVAQVGELLKAAGVKTTHVDGLLWMNEECGLSAAKMLNEALSSWLECEAPIYIKRAEKKQADPKHRKALAKIKATNAAVDKRTLFQRQLDETIAYLDFETGK